MPNEQVVPGGGIIPPSQEQATIDPANGIIELTPAEMSEFMQNSGYDTDGEDPLNPTQLVTNGMYLDYEYPGEPLVPNEPIYLKRLFKIEDGKVTQVAYIYMQAYSLSTNGYSYQFVAPDPRYNTFQPVTVTFE